MRWRRSLALLVCLSLLGPIPASVSLARADAVVYPKMRFSTPVARAFTGSQYVQTTEYPAVDIGGTQITVCVWARWSTSNTNSPLVAKWGTGPASAYALIISSSNADRVLFAVDAGGSSTAETSSTYNTGEWNFFCGIYNGSNILVTVNAGRTENVTGDAETDSIDLTDENIALATYSGQTGHLTGALAEATIFDRALSNPEQQWLMDEGPEGMAGLVFHELALTTGGTEFNLAPVSPRNNGTITGTTTLTDGPPSLRARYSQIARSFYVGPLAAPVGFPRWDYSVSSAMNFSTTTDRAEFASDSALNVTGNITIYCWAYLNAGGVNQAFVSKTNADNGAAQNPYDFRTNGGSLPLLHLVRADDSAPVVNRSSTGNVPLNSWRHIGFTHDTSGPLRFYIDGVEDSNFSEAGTPTSNTEPMFIGERGDGHGGNAAQANCGIHNVILTAGEMKEAMDFGFVLRGLVAAIVFVDGQAVDISRFMRMGTILATGTLPSQIHGPPLRNRFARSWYGAPGAVPVGFSRWNYDISASRLFNGSNEKVQANASPYSAYPITMAAWIYPDLSASDIFTALSASDTAGDNDLDAIQIQGAAAGDPGRILSLGTPDTVLVSTSNGSVGNSWNALMGIIAAADDRTIVLNGDWANRGTTATSTTPSGRDVIAAGVIPRLSETGWFDGRIAIVVVWNVGLVESEAVAFARGVDPRTIRPANIIFYWSLGEQNSYAHDLSGRGNHGSYTGTRAVVSGPPLRTRVDRSWYGAPGVAAVVAARRLRMYFVTKALSKNQVQGGAP